IRVDLIYKPKISRDTAVANVQKWLDSDNVSNPDTGSRSTIIEARLHCVPFWKIHADVKGFIDGYRVDPDGSEYPPRIPMHEDNNKTYTWNGVACGTKGFRVEHVCISAMLISPP